MKLKKLLSLALATSMVVLSVAGCGKSNSTETDTQSTTTEDAATNEGQETADTVTLTGAELMQQGIVNYKYKANELKKWEEQITITCGRPLDPDATELAAMKEVGEPYDDNRWINYYRDALNVNCEYTLINANGNDYNQQLLLAMSSGELPDIFWINDLSMISQMADAGAIYDLTEIYQNNVNETFGHLIEAEGTSIYSTGMYDGKLYAIPQKMPSTNAYDHLWVRRDWLEQLNLEVPQTMEDVKKVAQAFKDNMPDNIGMMFGNNFMWEQEGIFWAFGGGDNNARNQWYKQEDGTLAFSEVLPEMKEGLKWINDMYTSGLINSEWATEDTYAALANYVATNRCGIFYGPHWYGFSLQNFESSMDESADWVPVGLPNANGEEIKVRANNVTDGWICVSTNCENPEAVIQLLNAYTEKLFGTNNDFANFFACEQNSSLWKASPVWSLSATVDLDPCQTMMDAWDDSTKTMNEDKLTGAGKTYWGYITQGLSAYQYMFGPTDSCFNFVKKTYPDAMLWNEYNGAPTATQNDKWSYMQELIDTYYLRMINGEVDIDTGFDEMVKQWYELGGTEVTNEVNELYQSFQ